MNKIVWVICLVCLTSCASTHDRKVYVNTEPSGAVVRYNGATCETPCKVAISENGEYILRVNKAGYKEEKIEKGLSEWEKNPWVVGVAATATIGMLVVWPEMIPVAVISGLLSTKFNASNDTVHITMTPKEKNK